MRGHYGVIVLCVKTGYDVERDPAVDKRIEKTDIIVVAGPTKRSTGSAVDRRTTASGRA